jgi:pimeloyl-ACP methyl ester carboxylesterase
MGWRIWGEGTPLVLLHGGYGSWNHWIRNVLPLSEHFMVIAADMPGLGESDMPPKPYTAESLAAIIAEGLRQVVPEPMRFHLTGFSFGGVMSGHVAAILGENGATLTLIGAGGLGLPGGGMVKFKRQQSEMAPEELDALHRHNLKILMLADPVNVDDLAVYLQTINFRRARLRSQSYSRGNALRLVLPQVKAALKGIWGEQDATVGAYIAKREALLREVSRDLDFRLIEKAGHWVAYENPGPFNEVLIDMLKQGQ